MNREISSSLWLVIIATLVLVVLGSGMFILRSNVVDRIKSGKAELFCITVEGEKRIDPTLLVDFVDGYYVFVNGSASNCRVVKKSAKK